MRRRRRQHLETAFQVYDGPRLLPQFLLREAALQVVIEEAVASLDRARVIGDGPVVVLLHQAGIAPQGMEIGFAVKEIECSVRRGQRLVNVVACQRLATLVVGLVRGLQLHRTGHGRSIFGFALATACRQGCRRRPVGINPRLRRRMAGKQAAQPVAATTLAEAQKGLLQFDRPLRVIAGSR